MSIGVAIGVTKSFVDLANNVFSFIKSRQEGKALDTLKKEAITYIESWSNELKKHLDSEMKRIKLQIIKFIIIGLIIQTTLFVTILLLFFKR